MATAAARAGLVVIELQMLGGIADADIRVEHVAAADLQRSVQTDMVDQSTARPQLNRPADHAMRPDLHIVGQFRLIIHDCCRMHLRHGRV